MHIESVRHKGLRQLYEDNNAKGVQPSMADKLRKLLFAMETAAGLDDLTVSGMAAAPAEGRSWRILEPYRNR